MLIKRLLTNGTTGIAQKSMHCANSCSMFLALRFPNVSANTFQVNNYCSMLISPVDTNISSTSASAKLISK